MKPVSDMASYENQEVVNLSLTEARIKINDLENKLAFSNIRIAQCEKENDDLTEIVEKLYEKFLNKPLDDMIGKLESNLVLLNEAVQNVEQSDHNDESTSISNDDSIIFDDHQSIENGSQLKVDSRFKDTGGTNYNSNKGSINLNTDCEDIVDAEDSNENEANINSADLIAKVKESLKRLCEGVDRICNSMADGESNEIAKSALRCDEKVFTISDEDDSNQRDKRPASRLKVPHIIELDDSSSQSDANDCLLLSDSSDAAKNSTIDHQKRNYPSGIFQKPSFDDDGLCILPNVIDVSDSNVATPSQTDQRDNSSDSLPKSISTESDNLSTEVGEEDGLLQSDHSNEATHPNKQEKTSFCDVLQKPTVAELDDLSTGMNANPNTSSITCSKISHENSFSGVLQKLNPVKFDDSSIAIGTEVDLSQHDNSNDAKCSPIQTGISSTENSQNPTIDELDDSSLSQSDVESQVSHNSCSANSLKAHQEKSSFEVLQSNDSFELCNSSNESIEMVNSSRNNDSNSGTHTWVTSRLQSRSKSLHILNFHEKFVLKEEITEQETNAGKRAKLNRRASCSSLSPWLLSPHSTTSSLEDIRTRKIRLPSWPCPVCAECFANSLCYSKHLNQNHVGDVGVYTCSICHFVCPSISAHKRHLNKHHSVAILIGNRLQYIRHLNQNHDYAKTNFFKW